MPLALDAELALTAQSLQLQSRRLELLATNLANADTPNFKARDIDFRSVLNQTAESANTPKLATTQPMHLEGPSASSDAQAQYRVPMGPSLDGNTVDVQMEQAAFAETTVRYRSSLEFATDTFRGLMLAITGQGQ